MPGPSTDVSRFIPLQVTEYDGPRATMPVLNRSTSLALSVWISQPDSYEPCEKAYLATRNGFLAGLVSFRDVVGLFVGRYQLWERRKTLLLAAAHPDRIGGENLGSLPAELLTEKIVVYL